MKTALTEEKLTSLRAKAQAMPRSAFIDPFVIEESKEILRRRGEDWAASVLGHDLIKRSVLLPQYQWLKDYEPDVLMAADTEEWMQLSEEMDVE